MLSTDRQTERPTGLTGCPSIDKPWLKYYADGKHIDLNPNCGMYAFLRHCSEGRLEYTALNYFGRKISYQSLFNNIDQIACALQAVGIKKGDIVSLCGLNTPEFIYLLYAVNKVGAVSNWMGLTSPVTDLKTQLSSTDSKILFVIEPAYDKLKEASQDTCVERIVTVPIGYSMPIPMKVLLELKNRNKETDALTWREFRKLAVKKVSDDVEVKGGEMALIEYTGGSTGVPKGVMLSNKNLNSYYINFLGSNNKGYTNYHYGDRFLACVPLFLAFGVSTAGHGCLCHLQELILAPDPTPKVMSKIALKHKVNHIIAGRVQIEGLIQEAHHAKKDLSHLLSIMYGGEAANKAWEHASEEELKKYKMEASILNGYGMTETSAAILFTSTISSDGLIPFANVSVMITDPEDPLVELGYDTEGELCLSSDTVMMGYFKNELATKEVIFEKGGERWLRTRDLAMISSDGMVHITGRLKRIYHKLSPEKVGVRVYPMRIEEVILEKPEIEKCAVVGVQDERTAYRTIAYLVLQNPEVDTENFKKELDCFCRTRLPESHVPDEYVIVNEFPLTRAGKTDYRVLEKQAVEDRFD